MAVGPCISKKRTSGCQTAHLLLGYPDSEQSFVATSNSPVSTCAEESRAASPPGTHSSGWRCNAQVETNIPGGQLAAGEFLELGELRPAAHARACELEQELHHLTTLWPFRVDNAYSA